MKKYYSEYCLSDYGKEVQRHLPMCLKENITPLQAVFTRIHFNFTDIPAYERSVVAALGIAEATILSGKGTDFFIETDYVADLIISMVKDYTVDVLDVFAETRETAIIIHPPSPKPAVLVGIRTTHEGTSCIFCQSKGTDITQHGTLSFEKKDRHIPSGYTEKLAVGLALYARFFPESIRTGVPDDAAHPNHYKGKICNSISLSATLTERFGPKPHLRGAHFRFLGSERFTQKRGQYVPVSACFVRGKCKIVVEPQ
jgi:hypothetical protein